MPRDPAFNSVGGLREAPGSASKSSLDGACDGSPDRLWSSSNGVDGLEVHLNATVPDSCAAHVERRAVEQHETQDFLVPEADGPVPEERVQGTLDRAYEAAVPGAHVERRAVEQHDTEELLVPKADGPAPKRRLTYEEAQQIVGGRLLEYAAEDDAEAALTLWLHDHPRSYSCDSQEYREKLARFESNAEVARELNAIYNADNRFKDLCMFAEYEYADEIDLRDCAPGSLMECGDFVMDDFEIATELPP